MDKKDYVIIKNINNTILILEIRKSLILFLENIKKNISIIIHAAAQPSHDFAKNNVFLDFEINALGSLNIFDNAQKYCPNAKIIHLSTNKVYGDNPNKIRLIEKK